MSLHTSELVEEIGELASKRERDGVRWRVERGEGGRGGREGEVERRLALYNNVTPLPHPNRLVSHLPTI